MANNENKNLSRNRKRIDRGNKINNDMKKLIK